jgi:hypothetical protein
MLQDVADQSGMAEDDPPKPDPESKVSRCRSTSQFAVVQSVKPMARLDKTCYRGAY